MHTGLTGLSDECFRAAFIATTEAKTLARSCSCRVCQLRAIYATFTGVAATAVGLAATGDSRPLDALLEGVEKAKVASQPIGPAATATANPSTTIVGEALVDANRNGPTKFTVPGVGDFVVTPVNNMAVTSSIMPAAPPVNGKHDSARQAAVAPKPTVPRSKKKSRPVAKRKLQRAG